MRRSRLLVCACLAVASCSTEPPRAAPRLSLEETLGGSDTAGFARALEPRPFAFPDDHGPHPAFRNEWWYVTGNLRDSAGRGYGYQLTIFRTSLAPGERDGTSAWGTTQAYMGHFAVTDGAQGRFHAAERFARGAMALAGARPDPFRVWVEDWSIESLAPGRSGQGPTGIFPLHLRAVDGDVGVDLVLEAGKPLVLQGEAGLSRKGPEPGNASFYYSFTRMPTTGTVMVGADTLRATGASWLDREWSTSALSEGQVGWDWFALQLDDGREIMVYALRRADGSAHPRSDGILVEPDGGATRLAWGDDVTVTPTGSWSSPRDGAVYPSGWRVSVPGASLTLEVKPVLADQELDLAFRYWEGAVSVSGTARGRPVEGRGYVELTGYAGVLPTR